MKTIQLRAAEAISEDKGKGIVRIDTPFMTEMGVEDGDIVILEGTRRTFARAVRAYPGDSTIDLTRIDGFIRFGAGVGIGENVQIWKYLKE